MMIFPNMFQGYWTPPEEEGDFQLQPLAPLDPSKLGNLPPELAPRPAWNSPAANGRPEMYAQSSFPPNGLQHPGFRYPLSEFLPPGYNDSTLGSTMSSILDKGHLNNDEGPQPGSGWSRSYVNPVGTVYYPPSEADCRWANQAQESPQGTKTTSTPPRGYSNYYDFYHSQAIDRPQFYDPRPQTGIAGYLHQPAKPPPMALGAFLPMPMRPSPQGSQNFDISPKSRRSVKSQRPYSADVNQLFSVEEDARSHISNSSFKKGNDFFAYLRLYCAKACLITCLAF